MERSFPNLTPVRHKHLGYTGWIDDVTKNKDLFTGNRNCEWQYRVRTVEDEKRRIAPAEDLEIDVELRELPPWILDEYDSKGRRRETKLHKIGYQITGMHWDERWNVLINVAIPHFGSVAVIADICDISYGRLNCKSESHILKSIYALTEWRRDLTMLVERYGEEIKQKAPEIGSYVLNIFDMMESHGISGTVPPVIAVPVVTLEDLIRIRNERIAEIKE